MRRDKATILLESRGVLSSEVSGAVRHEELLYSEDVVSRAKWAEMGAVQ